MKKEYEFLEKLKDLKEKAETQNHRLSKDEVNAFFAEESLAEEQMLLVYDYLLAQKITVTGYIKSSEMQETKDRTEKGEYSAEEELYLKEYKKDLGALREEKQTERRELLEAVAKGEAQDKSRLIELYLPEVLQIALEMRCEEVFLGDLVQEGNVALMMALEMLGEIGTADDVEAAADELLKREIRQGIGLLIEEQTELKRRDKKMEHRVNELDETLHDLAEEKGRAVTIDELAEYMKLSEEAILDIMKLAGEDLYEKYKSGETEQE